MARAARVTKPASKGAKKQNTKAVHAEKLEEEFQLPSDSESETENGNDRNGEAEIEQTNESDDTDTENAIIGHTDSTDATTANTSTTTTTTINKSGHSIIKPVKTFTNKTDSDKSSKNSKTGVIYIGRLPNGFEEKELRQYFQQFGEITKLRLSRNKRTGKSKHYAFIEFQDYETAKVSQETMNNYLLMGHLLKVSLLDNSKINENLFVGANSKFKILPYNKINQLKNDKKRSLKEWESLNDNHLTNLKNKQENLKAKGIDYNINDL